MSNVIYGNTVGGGGALGKSVIIQGDDGTELVGVVVGQETVMTATPNDIRKGKIAATEAGIVEGEKDIPAYRTTAGYRAIKSGAAFSIPLAVNDKYDYTKIQCIITPYNTNFTDSVAADKIVLGDAVYLVGTTEKIAVISKNTDNKSIDLNITNDSDVNYVIHYFTYREEI